MLARKFYSSMGMEKYFFGLMITTKIHRKQMETRG
jgi:hypothetical protein